MLATCIKNFQYPFWAWCLYLKGQIEMNTRGTRFFTLSDLASAVTISAEEASHLLGISRTATYEAIHRNEIAVIRIGRRVRVLAKPLHDLLSGSQANLTA